jgi:hypothetical protein
MYCSVGRSYAAFRTGAEFHLNGDILVLTTAGLGHFLPPSLRIVFTPSRSWQIRTAKFVAMHPRRWTFGEESFNIPCMNAGGHLQDIVMKQWALSCHNRRYRRSGYQKLLPFSRFKSKMSAIISINPTSFDL